MERRQFNHATAAALVGAVYGLLPHPAMAISQSQATAALKQSLKSGAALAVKQLGTLDGFWGSEKVRIPLPSFLEQAKPLLKAFGQGERLDNLHLAVNRAAESAVASALPLLQNAAASMTVQDAVGLLKGGDTAVTDYFARVTRAPLQAQFLPTVQQATDQYKASAHYTSLLAKAQRYGVGKDQPATVAEHVTIKALESLYATVGEAEQRLRANPAQAASSVLRTVFGSL